MLIREPRVDPSPFPAGLFTLCEHYLSAPIKSVLEGVDELAAKGQADGDVIEKVSKGGQKIAELVAGALDTDLVMSDGLEVRRSIFSVAEATEMAAEAMDSAAESKGLEMIIDSAPDAPAYVLADSKRMVQVRGRGVGVGLGVRML